MAFQCPAVPHRDGVNRLLSRVPAHRSCCPPLRTPAPADHGAGCRIGCDHLPAEFLLGPSLPPVQNQLTAAFIASACVPTGTRARIRVPAFGCESISKVPFTW